jgi:pilus assembly protein CpaB
VIGRTATLELAPRQVETLGIARQMGTLWLSLRSLRDSKEADTAHGDGEGADDRSAGRVNIVRFGATTTAMPK